MGFVYFLSAVATFILLASASYVFYNLFLHPLAKYPGPITWRAFRLTMLSSMVKGDLPRDLVAVHKKYGSVVRTAPNELSFTDPTAWKDIYSRRDWNRPPQWRGKPPGSKADSFIQADGATHSRQRKAFGPAFTEQAVNGYESSAKKYVDILCKRIEEQKVVDIVKWLSFCLFDITMDIGWARNFQLLQKGDYHPWVTVTLGMKALIIGVFLTYYEPLGRWATSAMPKEAVDAIAMVLGIAEENTINRLKMETDRKDIYSFVLGKQQSPSDVGISTEELVANSMNFVIAGSESPTTVLAGALNYMSLQNPAALKILTAEVRGAFHAQDEIEHSVTKKLPYLNAVLNEAMRLAPTIPDSMRREIPEGGATVCGQQLPGGTVVGFHPLAAYMNDAVFERAMEFIPERWLSEPVTQGGLCGKDFEEDQKEAFQPFSYGPRGCIGKNLGWMEMRIILATLLWKFDIKTAPGVINEPWMTQKIFWLWDKAPLRLEFTPRI